MTIRIVGDIHNKIDQYIQIVKDQDFSIQLGDMGFNYEKLYELNPINHKILGGNHDNYYEENGIFVNQTPHFLTDFGVIQDIFYLRGANSIDRGKRIIGVNWFEKEECDHQTLCKAIEYYTILKPKIVISHDCPIQVIELMGKEPFKSKTNRALQAMFELHQPDFWYFGHHHQDISLNIGKTHFQCLNELSFVDLPQ